MDDYAQYSNMMNQINQINQAGKEVVNEKKEDQQEKLAEYKKTLEMTTEGIGGGILHDTGISLIKKGFAALKDKIPVPQEELENMLNDYKEGGAKKMFEGMTKRGYSKAKNKIFGDDDDAETSVKKVFGKLFKTGKSQSPSTVEPEPEDNLPATEPDFDNVASKADFKVQNKLLKDKVKSLDPDTQKQIQKDLNNDSTIKKPSELKDITDPEEKLTEQIKRGKALNDRVNQELPATDDKPLLQQAQDKLKTRLQQVTETEGEEEDAAKTGQGFFQNILDKQQQVQGQIQKAQGKLLQGGGEDDDDPATFQEPKPLGTEVVEKDAADDTIKDVAKKAGTRLAETDAELGGPEDPFGDVISGLVGLGTLLGGIFGAKKKHLPPTPAYVPINPTFQSGA
jgi:hypothetical protein